MRYEIKLKDKTKLFLSNFELGEELGTLLIANNKGIISDKEEIIFFFQELEDGKIEGNHSFFQGFFESLIKNKINIKFVKIADDETTFTKEAFDYAIKTWMERNVH